MSWNELLIISDKSYIKEIFFSSKVTDCVWYICLKAIPFQAVCLHVGIVGDLFWFISCLHPSHWHWTEGNKYFRHHFEYQIAVYISDPKPHCDQRSIRNREQSTEGNYGVQWSVVTPAPPLIMETKTVPAPAQFPNQGDSLLVDTQPSQHRLDSTHIPNIPTPLDPVILSSNNNRRGKKVSDISMMMSFI